MAKYYVLKDGTYADPGQCSKDDGVLKHENGMAVLMRPDGEPETVAVESKKKG